MPSLLARLALLVPLVFAIVSLVLSALCLFAGHEEGVLEDYAIIRLNTSGLGQNMFDFGSDDSAQTDNNNDNDGGFFDGITDRIGDAWDDIQETVEGGLNDLTGGVADILADEIGISEWYSLHVMTYCQGQYRPNATAHNAGLNVTECSDSSPDNRLNLTDILDQQLRVGPLELSLNDIDWPSDVQDAIQMLNNVLLGLFILYVLTMAFSGLTIIGTIVAVFLLSRGVVLINMVIASLGMLTSTIASIIVTVVMTRGIDELNDVGQDIGLQGQRGSQFLTLTWIVSAFMIAATASYTVQCCLLTRQRRRERAMARKEGGY
ncbi:actin cortical patch SUR7/pH-response regulator pali [Stachybotrys elegans]|uniref:Actin cortical patch SUR7/pH-response regulator pali n=1 Tax=Stachybotrys elegans TaxID=80388 RepID=A0A8K0T081_9HYPO|nr:actin cortical patch SUR7/pH-response regulator pali [Stachybotrys elegans]